jgi:hypothetical protein
LRRRHSIIHESGRGITPAVLLRVQGNPDERDELERAQHLLRGDLHRLRTQVEMLDLDLAADRPEGVPAGRQPLHPTALGASTSP